MKIDMFLIFLAILMILAMILTVVYGKKFSRHGYGLTAPSVHQMIASSADLSKELKTAQAQGAPFSIG